MTDFTKSTATRIPSLPEPSSPQFLQNVRELLRLRQGDVSTDPLDKWVTYRDLFTAGIANLTIGGVFTAPEAVTNPVASVVAQTVAQDLTPSPTPASLVATGAIGSVILSWTAAGTANFAYTEIWRSTTNNLGVAIRINTTRTSVYADMTGATSITYYYWIRHVNTADSAGPYNAASNAGTVATTAQVGHGDLAVNSIISGDAIIGNLAVTGAMIANATIVTANIGNLQVTDATIANLNGSKITAASIAANKLSVSQLSAITADMGSIAAGNITINSTGYIRGGQTAYNAGVGFWLGYNTASYKLSIGNPAGNSLTWDGTNLSLTGAVNVGMTGTFGALTVASGGNIKMGQSAYNTGIGFWLGDAGGGIPKFSIGTTSTSQTATGITRSGTTATLTVPSAITFPVGSVLPITVSGANQADYNGTFSATVATSATFTYTVANSPITPATGTILVRYGDSMTFDGAALKLTGQLTANAINAVNTINLVGQAVTIPVSVFTAAGTAPLGAATLQSASITSSGAPIYIYFTCIVTPSATDPANSFSWALNRNGSAIVSGTGTDALQALPIAITDIPGAGSFTYTVTTGGPATSVYTFSNRSLLLLETKR